MVELTQFLPFTFFRCTVGCSNFRFLHSRCLNVKKDTAIVKSKDYALEKFMLRLRLNTMPKRREAN